MRRRVMTAAVDWAARPEPELIAAVQQGDERAWRHLYGAQSQLVRYIVTRYMLMGADEADVDDVAAMVWARLVQGVGQFDPARGAWRAWVWTIARREAHSWVRRGRAWDASSLEEVIRRSRSREPDPEATRALTDPAPLPDRVTEARGQLDRVCEVVLPARQHQALDLWAKGYTHAEIGAALETTEATSRSLLSKGRARLLVAA
jgi:RNA polymerase sigma-70 factor, ECF subfamily